MKDVTLINASLARVRTVPAGILSVAAVLSRAGRRVAVRDYSFASDGALDMKTFLGICEDSTGVIGVGCMADSLPFVVHALEAFKERHPDRFVVVGGPGPSGVARELLEHFSRIDAVVIGEGELTMRELVDCLVGGDRADIERVKGICYRLGDEVRETAARERIRNLDELPLPLYESLPMEEYSLVNIAFSRGCPYRCTFCDVSPMWQRKHTRRSGESVIEEIAYLKDRFGKTDIEFTDETFVLKRPEVLALCAALTDRGLGVKWACTGRVNLVDEELLVEMARSGCRALFYGIESGSDAVLDRIRKDFTARQAMEAVQMTVKHVRPVASFIWGFPFETREDFLRTVLMTIYFSQIGADARLNRLAPFPLAPLTEEYADRLEWFDGQVGSSPLDPFQTFALSDEIRGMIRRWPRVFPGFYWLPTGGREEKLRMVEALGRYRPASEWPAAPEPGPPRASRPSQRCAS